MLAFKINKLKVMFVTQTLLLTLLKAQSIITTVAGNGIQGFSGDNSLAINAALQRPESVYFDKSGNFFIADIANNRVRKISTSGIITTIAGTGTAGYSGDSGPATTAQLNNPIGVTVDDTGNIYIADYNNSRIRKITTSGIITTVAGTGTAGYSGDNGFATAAKLNYSAGIVFDNLGNLYITDNYNHRIRKVNTSGIITTIAGIGIAGFSGDTGPATSAQLNNPGNIVFDKTGNLYFADDGNHRIRKIDNSGIITTIAGTGVAGFNGDSGTAISAQLNQPFGITCDAVGNIYVSDQLNHRIRKINTVGIITTIVGNGTPGYNGDNISATAAQLYYPEGITFDTAGNLYIADNYNNRIRKVTNVAVGVNELKIKDAELRIYPNPNTGNFTVAFTGKAKKLSVEIYNVFGQLVLNKTFEIENTTEIKIDNLTEGVYLVKLLIDGIHNKTERIVVTK